VGVPKKSTGFFWVRTRVSEPCETVNYQNHSAIGSIAALPMAAGPQLAMPILT